MNKRKYDILWPVLVACLLAVLLAMLATPASGRPVAPEDSAYPPIGETTQTPQDIQPTATIGATATITIAPTMTPVQGIDRSNTPPTPTPPNPAEGISTPTPPNPADSGYPYPPLPADTPPPYPYPSQPTSWPEPWCFVIDEPCKGD